MRLAECRSCQAPIVWTVTTNGKKMPVDADAILEHRGFRLRQDEDPPVAEYIVAPERGEFLHAAHFATCPNANQHRRS